MVTEGKGKTCEVLVVGAGLSGLALALQLARDGIKVMVVDKAASKEVKFDACQGGGTLLTPANVLWARKLGIYQKLRDSPGCEIVKDLVGLSNPTLISNGKVQDNAIQDDGGKEGASEKYGNIKRELSEMKRYSGDECSYVNINQRNIEECLFQELRNSKLVDIVWRQQFEAVDANEKIVVCSVRDLSSQEAYEIRCGFVVGCDGRSSKVRSSCFHEDNIENFEWKEHKGVMLHMMCECQLRWKLDRKPYRLEQKSMGGFGPTVGGGAAMPVPSTNKQLYRLSVNAPFTMWGSQIDSIDSPPLALLQKQLKPKLPKGSELIDLQWSKYYRMNHFISSRFRCGRAFLAGEAAHAHPPVGILPMNSVIEDTQNLAWKLALAIKLGVTDPECSLLLESYDSERRAQAEEVRKGIATYFSDLMQGKLRPSFYAHNDCGLFSNYVQSPILIHSSSEEKCLAKVGGIAPNVNKLLLTNTMKNTTLESIMLSSNKHKIFCFCSEWPIEIDSPYAGDSPSQSAGSMSNSLRADSSSTGYQSGKRKEGGAMNMTWEKLQQSIELKLGSEFISLCEIYILHSTPKIAHGDGLDTQLLCQAVHLVDEEGLFKKVYFSREDCFGGAALIRPDFRVGAIGELPAFLEDLSKFAIG